jgi:CheY-like chemotaxis protein/anti-sigma regulatory factor (Ser/Thr protein kinase)
MAAAKHITLDCSYRITSEQVEGDSDRVQQIFWNLLSNAVKFTPQDGHIWLAAGRVNGDIHVTVRDDGVGIAPDFLPCLFDRFSQKDTSSTRHHSGLGLGLFLVRHLVELHGGKVYVESEGEGKGTSFTVVIPLRLRDEKYVPATASDPDSLCGMMVPSLQGLRILLIDDEAEARESLTVVLTTAGAQIHAAGSAREALAWLATLGEAELPDIVVSDIAMPGEDGYATLRKLRTWKLHDRAPLQRIPALALTAFAQREDRIRALTSGFQMHLTKPVAPEELIVVIDTMVERRPLQV